MMEEGIWYKERGKAGKRNFECLWNSVIGVSNIKFHSTTRADHMANPRLALAKFRRDPEHHHYPHALVAGVQLQAHMVMLPLEAVQRWQTACPDPASSCVLSMYHDS